MATEVLSNVGNKYIIAEESTYGTKPAPFTALDFGHVQNITISEDDTVEEISSMNSEHTLIDLDDDLYNLSGTITTKCTKASMAVLLKALCGDFTDNGDGTYTIITAPVTSDDLSYSMKVNTTTGKTKEMTGMCITGGEITVNKDASVEMSLNYQAQKLATATEALAPSTNVGDVFRGLDATVTYDGNATILDTFTIAVDWNVAPEDGRGIEVESANGRRVINRIIRHNLSLTGSFESEMDDNIDTGYEDERSNIPIVLTLARGSSNDHVFTIAASRTNTRSRDMNNDNETKKLSCDYIGLDISIDGDLFASS